MNTSKDMRKQLGETSNSKQNNKKKTAKNTPDTGTIAMLEMIHDRVQKSKRKDRYIVTSNNKWGVTDSQGNFVIPMQFSLIQTSNDSVFRVYGEGTGHIIGNYQYSAELKEQAVYDYDGKCLMPMGIYSKVLASGKFGLIFGQSKQLNEFTDRLKVLKYTGEVLDLANENICLSISDSVPNMVLAKEIRANGRIETSHTLGIMLDTDKLELKPLENCYNSIVYPEITGKDLLEGEITSDIDLLSGTLARIKQNLSVMYHTDREKVKYIVGKTNSGELLIHTDYTPVINLNDKKAKIKNIFHGLMEE